MQIIFIFFLIITPQFANAYVGPALGIGGIILIILFFFASFIIVFSIIYYPIKYIKKKIKKFK